ncbi:MAG: carbohydrate binding family 9 domain-containing protein [Planctomycetes bacterium]|nr:carbohydrate binding family 9 domain-containing protein [Planctomycetota bacterium]
MFFRSILLAAGLLAGTALAPPPLPARDNQPAPPPPKELEGPKPAEGEKPPRSPPPASRKVKIPSAEPQRELKAARVIRPPAVDGSLNDDAWKEAESGGPLVQVMPEPGEEPTEHTDFRVVYDDSTLYIGVWCYDREPDRIVATEMALDGRISSDDYITIALDTFFDRRNGYHLQVNPNGARHDALITNNVSLNENWDGIWIARARIDSEGWKAEVAIPFDSISFNPGSETWGFNLSRTIKRKFEKGRWNDPSPEINTYNVAEAGNLTGLRGLKQGLGLELRPYALGKFRYQHSPLDSDLTGDAGGEIRYRITPNLTSSLSYNTDFAETEVDMRQINLTRFPLFFPEKRSFFLEDAGIFGFGGLGSELLPFYSRRIGLGGSGEVVPIIGAGKLTGRVNTYNLGFLDAVLDDHDDLGVKNAFLGRVSKNIFEQSSLGMIATYGDPNSDLENFAGGLDFDYRTDELFGDNILQGNAFTLGSYTEGQSGGDSMAFGAGLSLPNDLYSASARFYQIDENFNAGLGFVPRKGIRAYSSFLSWKPRLTSVDSIRQMYFMYGNSHITGLDDKLDTASHSIYPLYVVFESADDLYFNASYVYDSPDQDFEISPGVVIPSDEYWWGQYLFGFDTATKRPVDLNFYYGFGDFYDGRRNTYSTGVNLKPIKYLTFRLGYALNQVRLPEGDFDTRLGSARMQVSFTPDLIWHHLVQHDSVSDTLGYNSRLIWRFRSGANLFIVLNQNIDRENSHLTWLESELTVKVNVSFRF